MFTKKDDSLVALVNSFNTISVVVAFVSFVVLPVVYIAILMSHPSALVVGIVAYLAMMETALLAEVLYKEFKRFFVR